LTEGQKSIIFIEEEALRLSEFEIDAIKKSIYHLDPGAEIFLFGSRVDDSKKGGDIDLLILSSNLTPSDKIKIKAFLFKVLEEQKIDITIAADTKKPFVRLALKNGVAL
jgi:predicted nucleotidyltransferase